MIKKKKTIFDIGWIVKWGSKIDKIIFVVLKAKIFSTTTMNALTSTTTTKKKKKKKILGILVFKKKKKIVSVFVFIGKSLNLNVFRNNDFEYL